MDTHVIPFDKLVSFPQNIRHEDWFELHDMNSCLRTGHDIQWWWRIQEKERLKELFLGLSCKSSEERQTDRKMTLGIGKQVKCRYRWLVSYSSCFCPSILFNVFSRWWWRWKRQESSVVLLLFALLLIFLSVSVVDHFFFVNDDDLLLHDDIDVFLRPTSSYYVTVTLTGRAGGL